MSNYHSIKALSNSSLSVLKRSPTEFYRRFVTEDPKERMIVEESDAMLLGSAVHMLALEPERFDAQYVVLDGPINPQTGKPYGRGTKKFESWLFDSASIGDGRTMLIREEFAESLAIAQAFQAHPVIAAIMASRAEKLFESEYSMKYPAGDDKVKMKCKIDFVCPAEQLIIDLKTTSDPSPYAWSWSAEDFGYHRQAAIYSDAMQAKYGEPFRFLFGVVRSKEPYEAAVYEIDAESINRGRVEYEALIEEYIDRKAENDWLSDWQRGVFPINVPTRRRK